MFTSSGISASRPRYSSSRRPSIHFSVSSRRCSSCRSYFTVTRAWRFWIPGLRAGSARVLPGERAGDPRPSRLPTRFAAIPALRRHGSRKPAQPAAYGVGRGRAGLRAGLGTAPREAHGPGGTVRGEGAPRDGERLAGHHTWGALGGSEAREGGRAEGQRGRAKAAPGLGEAGLEPGGHWCLGAHGGGLSTRPAHCLAWGAHSQDPGAGGGVFPG